MCSTVVEIPSGSMCSHDGLIYHTRIISDDSVYFYAPKNQKSKKPCYYVVFNAHVDLQCYPPAIHVEILAYSNLHTQLS